jgi:hypothetical protein
LKFFFPSQGQAAAPWHARRRCPKLPIPHHGVHAPPGLAPSLRLAGTTAVHQKGRPFPVGVTPSTFLLPTCPPKRRHETSRAGSLVQPLVCTSQPDSSTSSGSQKSGVAAEDWRADAYPLILRDGYFPHEYLDPNLTSPRCRPAAVACHCAWADCLYAAPGDWTPHRICMPYSGALQGTMTP